MKIQELRKLIREEIRSLKENETHMASFLRTSRKPIDYSDVKAINQYNNLPPHVQEWLDGLDIIDGDKYENWDDIVVYDTNYYIIEKDGVEYFVNMEGYDYPRYVGIINR